jgi:type III secretion system (T3SS) SseB-like protein
LREQDGPVERELKNHLVALFHREESIRAAYLVQVAYADDQENAVALCLRADPPNHDAIGKIGQIFSTLLGAHEHLDILFLDDATEAQLAGSCGAFWSTPRP